MNSTENVSGAAAGEVLCREQQYWDSVPEFRWLTQQSIASVVANCPPFGGDVLELCSGIGVFTAATSLGARSYTCLDLSSTRLASLRRVLANLKLVQGDAQKLAFADSSFDYVCVFAGLHHLPDYQAALRESYRVLRPNGHFVCFEPNAECWYRKIANPIRRMTGLFTEDEVFLSPLEIVSRLENAGFARIAQQYLSPRYDADFLGNPVNRLLARLVYAASSLASKPTWQAFALISASKPLQGGREP